MPRLSDLIHDNLSNYSIEYRIHATRRIFQRNIHEDDIETVLTEGEIIEQYGEDFPLPSMLINGKTSGGRPLHIVTAVNDMERRIIIITAYEPDEIRWMADFSRRIK